METSKDKKSETITQESLQPQRINKGTGPYQSVLDIEARLQEKDATNIALTGPYGSGKSSVLITLKEDFPEHHYLNISLATLEPYKEAIPEENPSDAVNEELEETGDLEHNNKEKSRSSKQNIDRLIEYSILQQLVYREKQETLKYSRLKRIFHLPKNKVNSIAIKTLIALLALIIFFEPSMLRVEWMCRLFGRESLNIIFDLVSSVYLAFYAYWALRKVIPTISNSKLNKLNIKSGEIEIVKNTSIFNKHLDEILYFFEQTNYEVVILEDLDRFDSADIFLKLRELNLLLNESKVINRTISFIYAVRDDMFRDEDRVKCFDYIATVIPVINLSNAKDKLKEELERRGVNEIGEAHLKELGFFLHDMRLLKNIANEYVQYRGKISKGISCEKLLGMIVYKNYYPQDFAALHDGEGIVYRLLNLKDVFVAERIEKLEAENKNKQEKRIAYLQERHLREKELRRIYVEAYRDKVGNKALSLKAGDGMYGFREIAADEKLFDKLISDPTVTYSYNSYVNYSLKTQQQSVNIPFSEIERNVDNSISYKDRLAVLRNGFALLEDEVIVDIRKEDIRSQPLSQIMCELDYKSNNEYQELKVPKMIEYLVVHGYIDDNYYDYISYFYGNFIDSHDWEFVLDLKLWKHHPYDFHVNNVKACLEEIPDIVYRKNAILNVDILDYLASHSSDKTNMKRLVLVLRTAVQGKKYDFLATYFKTGKQQDIVFEQLFNYQKNLWPVFEKSDDEENRLKLIWFKYAEKEQGCKESRQWLSAHFDFITDNLLDIDEPQWETMICEGNYEFEEINGLSSGVLKAVADNDAYKLTRHNVETLVTSLLDMTVDSLSYRLVLETKHEALINRVENNLSECMHSIFNKPESERENEYAIVGILLSSNVTEEEKMAYLANQRNTINLESVEQNNDKTLALKCDVAAVSWESVIHYMNSVSEQKTDDVLTAFVEKHAVELAEKDFPADQENDELMLMNGLIATDTLTLHSYEVLLGRFEKWHYSKMPEIQEERVSLMINRGMVRFTDDNTTILQEKYSDKAFSEYLLKNKKGFLKRKETVTYTTGLALILLKSNMTVHEKASLIPLFSLDILNMEVANAVMGILKVDHVPLKPEFIIRVMSLSHMTNEKILFLNYTLEKNPYDELYITSLLKSLPRPYSNIAEKGKKPELPNTYQVKKLVEALKKHGFISSYSETERGIRVNTKMK